MGTKADKFKKLYRITNNKTGEVFETRGQREVMVLAGLDAKTAKRVLEKSQKWEIEILDGPADWNEAEYRRELYGDSKHRYAMYEAKKLALDPLYETRKRMRLKGHKNLDGTRFTAEQHAELRANPCQVCGHAISVVDHCHTTGVVRGALCRGCNLALGFAKDSVDTLSGLIDYLKRAQESINNRTTNAEN